MSEFRISKLMNYLYNIIDGLSKDTKFLINADFLGDIGDFSLDRIPTATEVEKWVIGITKRKDTYSFRSRKAYSKDTLNNLKNIGFFEEFEKIIKSNNDKGILPEINGIESIECLNSGTLINVNGTEGTFNIQIQIIYIEDTEESDISM